MGPDDFNIKRKYVVSEMKEVDRKLSELGLNSGAMLEIVRGQAHLQGEYELKVSLVKLIVEDLNKPIEGQQEEPESITGLVKEGSLVYEKLYDKVQLGSLKVKSDSTIENLRQKILDELLKPVAEFANIELGQIRLRNPKNDDLGEVLPPENDGIQIDSLFVYDGKEFIVQISDKLIEPCEKTYLILVREWKPDTWEFGPLFEVGVQRMMSCDQLALFLQANFYPHIAINNLFGLKVNILKEWTRSEVVLRSWHSLHSQKDWIGRSSLEINRDSVFVVVKDSSVQQRHLKFGQDDALIRRYAGPQYVQHISSKGQPHIAVSGTKFDSLYEAAHSYSVSQSQKPAANYSKEQGIKITVRQGAKPASPTQASSTADDQQQSQPAEEEGGVPDDFEPLF